MPTKRNKKLATTTTVVEHAREIADAGDRWFLSVAGGLGRVGEWARREADIAADSAVAAFATTVHVAKRLTGARGEPGPAEPSALPRESESPKTRNPRPRARRAKQDPPESIDLMAAMPASAWPHLRSQWNAGSNSGDPELSSAPGGRNPAGVVPVLQALGRTVADHTLGGYATLQRDERFWTLIHLLQVLGRPNLPTGLGPDTELMAASGDPKVEADARREVPGASANPSQGKTDE